MLGISGGGGGFFDSMILSFLYTYVPPFLVCFYLYATYTKLNELANPLHGVDVASMTSQGFVVPLWQQGERFQLIAFLSHTSKFIKYSVSALERDNMLLINVDNLTFNNESYDEMKFKLNIRRPGYASSTSTKKRKEELQEQR